MEVLTASVFSVKNETKSSCGSKDKSRGVGSVCVGGAWTWHCAALRAPGRSCAHGRRGGPLTLSFLGVGGVGGEVDVGHVGVLLRKV